MGNSRTDQPALPEKTVQRCLSWFHREKRTPEREGRLGHS